MNDVSDGSAGLGGTLARVEAFAGGVGRRTRFWGLAALIAAPVIWAIFLRKWVFDSWGVFAAWLPLLLAMLVPGVVLLGFGRRVGRLAELPGEVTAELGGLVEGARHDAAAEIAGVKAKGLGGLQSLIGSLRDLRTYGDDVRELVRGVVGSLRFLNPLYLIIVTASAMAAGLLAILMVGALLLLVVV